MKNLCAPTEFHLFVKLYYSKNYDFETLPPRYHYNRSVPQNVIFKWHFLRKSTIVADRYFPQIIISHIKLR
jgi:hypothetical protein